MKPQEELSHSASPGVQNRWAQIRKNAANRAADGDEDTSGEETIESRVARIKARVAELTGNMEGSARPQAVPRAR